MTGAESIVQTLLDGGVDVCFANPGTSEMHFVSALDRIGAMRCVLGLFEGVVTGSADGYGRMTGKPAATLLHLGPGFSNGAANLHNARRARTPIVNIVGEHATGHLKYDSPLTTRLSDVAGPFSDWILRAQSSQSAAKDAAEAIRAARTGNGQVASLLLSADAAWGPCDGPERVRAPDATARIGSKAMDEAIRMLSSGEPTGLILGGQTLGAASLECAGRIAAATGARIMAYNLVPRLERGAGRVVLETIPYPVDMALAFLKGFKNLIVAASEAPVAFFAYPGKPSVLTPADCRIHTLARPDEDAATAICELADVLAKNIAPAHVACFQKSEPARGAISSAAMGQSIAAMLLDNAIVVDESITAGKDFGAATRHARPHDLLKNMGGSIGFGMPAATGAAIACPDRKVLCLQADGSGMFTLQALWTHGRENLDILTIIFSNRTYAILHGEFVNVGAGKPGPRAERMMNIGSPDLDWCSLSRGMGVEASRATDMDMFNAQFASAMAQRGPRLIEVIL